MRNNLIALLAILITSCTADPNTFVLQDSDKDKFYLSDSIQKAFKSGQIGKSPLIAIDGIVFKYEKSSDTIILPLKKKQITAIAFLHKKGSSNIFGKDANKGAVIINTVDLLKSTPDTIREK